MFSFEFDKPQLKVLSNIFGNLVVVWIATTLGTRSLLVLTVNIGLAIISWRIAVSIERLLEVYDN